PRKSHSKRAMSVSRLPLRANDAEHRVHPTFPVVCNRTPEHVPARYELQLAVDDLARLHAREPKDVRAADAPHVEVMGVLAAVDELDDHVAGSHGGARQAVAELLRDHLDPRGRGRLRSDDHATSLGRVKEPAPGITAAASTPNHCSSRAE